MVANTGSAGQISIKYGVSKAVGEKRSVRRQLKGKAHTMLYPN